MATLIALIQRYFYLTMGVIFVGTVFTMYLQNTLSIGSFIGYALCGAILCMTQHMCDRLNKGENWKKGLLVGMGLILVLGVIAIVVPILDGQRVFHL